MLVFVAFVPVYMAISDNCGLKIGEDSGEPFLDALYLSVETMTTIGYVHVPTCQRANAAAHVRTCWRARTALKRCARAGAHAPC